MCKRTVETVATASRGLDEWECAVALTVAHAHPIYLLILGLRSRHPQKRKFVHRHHERQRLVNERNQRSLVQVDAGGDIGAAAQRSRVPTPAPPPVRSDRRSTHRPQSIHAHSLTHSHQQHTHNNKRHTVPGSASATWFARTARHSQFHWRTHRPPTAQPVNRSTHG